ncbi:MAG: T9SS type A sorting domain-containing protein, partial [Bacteroidetes bacterium]|nr:T9SS type A sorting domain-containing protein [Bacteroidota bacterium]
ISASCFGQSDGIASVTGVGTGPYNYEWKDGVGNTISTSTNSLADTEVKTNLSAGTYSVEMSDKSGLCAITEVINIGQPDTLISSFLSLEKINLFEGGEMVFQNTSSDTSDCFWNFGDASTSKEVNPKHIYSSTGDFNVSLTVAKDGCYSSYNKSVKVIQDIPTSIETIKSDNDVILFPNPSTGLVTLSSDYKNSIVQVFDIQGKLISEGMTDNSGRFSKDMSNNRNGIYSFSIQGPQQSITRKLLLDK